MFSMAVGVSGLLAWRLRIQILKTWDYGAVTMKANTSACFLFLGMSLWLLRNERRKSGPSFAEAVARVLASIVCMVGALSALEYLLGWHLGIDQFLSLEFPRDPSSGARPGLMSPVTGSIFLLLGLALIALDWGKKHWSWAAEFLCLGAVGASVFGLSTVFVMPGINKLSLALPTTVTFPVLSVGILCARAEWALGGLATGTSAGARVFRRAAPVALLVLGAIGWTISTPLLTTTHLSWIEAALLAVVCGGLLIGFLIWMTLVVERSQTEVRMRTAHEGRDTSQARDLIANGRIEVRLRRNATLGFVLAVLLTAALGVLSEMNTQKTAQEEAWVAHTQEVIAVLETTSRHLDDVETGGRGFLLTGEDSFLKPYDAGRHALAADLAQLRQLTADNSSQQQSTDLLETEVNARIEHSSVMLSMRQAGNMPTVQRLEEGKALMDAARATTDEMIEAERKLLRERKQQSDAALQLSKFVVTLASLLGAIFLALAGLSVRSLIDANAQARAETVALNADLERRVERRTADLSESEGRLAGVIQSAMDAIIAHDEQQRILVFNVAAEKMFRCRAGDVLGQPIERFIPERYRKTHRQLIRKFAESGVTSRNMIAPTTLWALRADGEEFPMEASISQTKAGGRRLFTVIVRDVSEQVRAESNSLRLAAIVESTDSAILSKNLDGIVTSWNKGAELLYGYSESEMLGRHISEIIPAELRGEEAESLSQVAQGRLVRRNESLRKRKDGSLISVSLILSPVKDASGKIIGASAISHDITESKRKENRLREQGQLLDLAQVLVRDMDSRIVMWSSGAEKLYGFCSGEAVGKISHELLQTRFPVRRMEIESAFLRDGRWEGELVHRKKDGSTVVVNSTWVLRRNEKGNPLQILEVNSDITARKTAERMLAASEERMGMFIEHAPAALAMFDREMRYLYVSHRWLSDYGVESRDVRGLSHYEVFPDVPEYWKQLHRRALAGEILTADCDRFERADGTVQWVKWEIRPWRNAAGEVGGILIFAEDITGSKLAEREIRKLNEELEERVTQRTAELAEANRELEAFTYSVSHDLRAPLRHIGGFSRILMEDFGPELAPEARDHVQRIEDGVRRMGLLVDELLNLARVGRHPLKLQPTDLNGIVEEVISLLQPDVAGRTVHWKIAKLPPASCDPVLIRQVFQNFIANALKFTRPRESADIEINCRREEGTLVIAVRDNGVGFNMKYADKLFGVFQRLHRSEDFEGTGVGLATVQRIMQKHGGRVWAESEVDKGATFFFTLAAAEAALPAVLPEAEATGSAKEAGKPAIAGAQV